MRERHPKGRGETDGMSKDVREGHAFERTRRGNEQKRKKMMKIHEKIALFSKEITVNHIFKYQNDRPAILSTQI